jgi:hypothetical protein
LVNACTYLSSWDASEIYRRFTIEINEKAEPNLTLPLISIVEYSIYFLNFFLANPANPINPDPKRSMVAGSGTGPGASTVYVPDNTLLFNSSRFPV